MVTAQIYYCHDGSIKKLLKKSSKKANQKNPNKMVGSKTTCPKWHFGQVGHKDKKIIWMVFFTESPNKKAMISCSEMTLEDIIMGLEKKGKQ